MTRLGLLSALLSVPVVGSLRRNAQSNDDEATIVLGPGTYVVGPNGSIRFAAKGRVTIRGVTFQASREGSRPKRKP